jgi:hypothetical protein
MGDRTLARAHLAEALRLLPMDTDPSLIPTSRQGIERAATTMLTSLREQEK